MITFSCPSCNKQYNVKDEFAGKKTACRVCSTNMLVPIPEVQVTPPVVQVRNCAFCDSEITVAAKKCKHCGETVDVALRAAEEAQREAREARSESRRGSDSNQQVVINQSSSRLGTYVPFPRHLVHLALTLLTCGFWSIIWIIDYACYNPRKEW